MIRINLLGAQKKKGKRGLGGGSTTASPSLSLPQMQVGQGVVWLAAVLIAVGVFYGCFWWGNQLSERHDQLQRDIKAKEVRLRQLKAIKEAYDTKQKQQSQLQQHFDVIDHLRASQAAPGPLLGVIGGTVGRTDTVWLTSITDEVPPMPDPSRGGKGSGQGVELVGYAGSSDAVARFMNNLMSSGFFSSVRLKDTKEGESNGVAVFSFTLVCEKTIEKKV